MRRSLRLLNRIYLGLSIVIRTFIYKQLFASFGKGSRVLGRITVLKPERIAMGDNSTLNEGVFLGGLGKIEIGDNVHVSPGVIINSGYLKTTNFKKKEHATKKVIIESHVWICSGAIINPGVKIGSLSVIGAGAVVTEDVPTKSIVAGVPAKKIGEIKS